ncbi:MAG TPA: cytochrome P460 family protein [Chloroflexota bacterium]|nr:cytochrome P460 family protein [Chloroflexota bacterium]
MSRIGWWLRRRMAAFAIGAAGVAFGTAAGVDAQAGPGVQPAPLMVPVDLEEWLVRPHLEPSGLPAGVPVRFLVKNRGGISHALAVAGLNTQTATLAPGESAPLDVVFGAAGAVTLFCPLGGGSHRERGMQAALDVTPALAGQVAGATPVPPPTPTAGALTAPGADEDRVRVPADYRTSLLPFYVFDRADNRQVRAVFVNPTGAQVRPGQPFPYGTLLVMETYRAQLDGEQIALDDSGRFIRGELTGVFAMRKEPGFGAKYGVDRTGEWEYVAYRPDLGGFTTPPERSLACAQCHLATSDRQRDWVVRGDLFFAAGAGLQGGIAALPRTGHGLTAGLGPLAPLALALGAPLFALAGLAVRSLARRRR